MSLEIILIPAAIALTKQVAEGISQALENKDGRFLLIETRMRNEQLLRQALGDWDCSFRSIDGIEEMGYPLQDMKEIAFWVNEEGCYTLVLPEDADQEEYRKWLEEVEKSYTSHLQQQVYQRLLAQAEDQGLVLEQEERLQDSSIQLTYILNR